MLQVSPVPNGIPPRPELAVEPFDDATGRPVACETTPDSPTAPPAEAAGEAGAGAAVNLPLDLLDQLLASTVVPHAAKLAAIDAWRHELAEAQLHDPALGLGAVHDRLSAAPRLLAHMRQRVDSDVEGDTAHGL
jgi:hypothetical protein